MKSALCISWGKRLIDYVSFFLFPAFCTSCNDLISIRTALCNECKQLVHAVVSHKLTITQKYQMEVYAVGAYQDPLRKLIIAKTYQDRLACYYMAELIYQHMLTMQLSADYLVVVPLHWSRYALRGYNQSHEIAKHLSAWTGIPIVHLLKRVKKTEFQSQLDKNKRHLNLNEAFALTQDKRLLKHVHYKRLLLVDDVMTTGATLYEAAHTLLPLKPLSLKAVVLARTV